MSRKDAAVWFEIAVRDLDKGIAFQDIPTGPAG